jgi:hypothetical protein
LRVRAVAGEGAVNNVVVGVAAQPVVEVTDGKNAPVANADVTFEAPADGPSGSFMGQRTQTVKSDAKGRALVNGFLPNSQTGRFQIKVTAAANGATATTTINQTNGGPGLGNQMMANPSRRKLWTVVGIVAAAGIGGGLAASLGGGGSAASDPTKRPVTIGAGPITVGGPR